MSRVAETANCVNSKASVPTKTQRILELLKEGVHSNQIAVLVGTTPATVRGICSRYSAPDRATFLQRTGAYRAARPRSNFVPGLNLPRAPRRRSGPPRRGYRPNPTGQPREELRELALTLYRWRQEGRYAL